MLKRTLLCLLAMGAFLASCTPGEDNLEPQKPAAVEKLTTPRNGLSVNMYLLEALQFEWKPAGENVQYELVFDVAGGDFSSPVASFTTDGNSILFDKSGIQEIFEKNADMNGEVADLSWAVYTLSDDARTLSAETRRIIFTTISSPAVVETLISPQGGTTLNLEAMDAAGIEFSWSDAVWIGSDDAVGYTLAIDDASGDFSAPLYQAESSVTSAVVSRETLAGIYSGSQAASSGEPYALKWAVYANVGTLKTISRETRSFSLIPSVKVKPFEPGDPLYISIPSSSESGQVMTFIDSSYYRTDNDSWHDRLDEWKTGAFPYYEIFTSLSAGQEYSFYTMDEKSEKTHFFRLGEDGLVEVETEEEAYVKASQDGIYRIRIKTGDRFMYDFRKVESVSLRFSWGSNDYTDTWMTYAGRGLWTIPAYHIELMDRGGWYEDRYRFMMKMEGIASPYGLSKNNEGLVTSSRPGQNESPSYWHVQLSYTGWDHWVFKYPAWLCDESNPGRWCADVNLYMNADKGHYTHEFVNPVEVKSFEDGDPLYIEGEGTEGGQKMSYITSSSYNTSIGESGEVDAFKGQDYRYEMFTRLSAGARLYFRSETGADLYALDETGTEVRRISSVSDACAPVSEDGVYRIRFNVVSGKAYIAKVDEVSHFYCFTQGLTPMEYMGKGVWAIENLHIELQRAGWGVEERYKFKFIIDGEAQPYGRMSTYGNRPDESTAADYWYLQPTVPNQWDPSFKYPDSLYDENDLSRWYTDLYLYMNDDKGHYTHEFRNAHE